MALKTNEQQQRKTEAKKKRNGSNSTDEICIIDEHKCDLYEHLLFFHLMFEFPKRKRALIESTLFL